MSQMKNGMRFLTMAGLIVIWNPMIGVNRQAGEYGEVTRMIWLDSYKKLDEGNYKTIHCCRFYV